MRPALTRLWRFLELQRAEKDTAYWSETLAKRIAQAPPAPEGERKRAPEKGRALTVVSLGLWDDLRGFTEMKWN